MFRYCNCQEESNHYVNYYEVCQNRTEIKNSSKIYNGRNMKNIQTFFNFILKSQIDRDGTLKNNRKKEQIFK